MKRTTITLTEDLASLIEMEARRRSTSVSGVVRDLLEEALGSRRPPALAWAGVVTDRTDVRARDLDEHLEAGWADDLDRDRR